VRRDFAQRMQRLLGRDHTVTASFGVSAVAAGEASLEPALRRADQALYQAKSAGRNCCVVKSAIAASAHGRRSGATRAATLPAAAPPPDTPLDSAAHLLGARPERQTRLSLIRPRPSAPGFAQA
jgi:hypothetical protein